MGARCSLSVSRLWRVTIALVVVAAVVTMSGVGPASAATCHRVQTPNGGSPADDEFLAVSVTSSRNAWVVGDHTNEHGDSKTLIEHWNGRAWKIQASPKLDFQLVGVAATSSTNAWAVGEPTNGRGDSKTLIEHWNGRAWKIQAGPKFDGHLSGVAATSSINAWAVGAYSEGKPLIEHWNGNAWKVQASPKLNPTSELFGVAAISSTNAWAVGHYQDAAGVDKTLIEHWNGRAWKVQASPNPILHFPRQDLSDGTQHRELVSVAASSSTNVWAVGDGNDVQEGTETQTLIEHWNGKAWKIQASPTERGGFDPTNFLNGVAAISSTNAWAVSTPIKGDTIEHWNGKAWKLRASPGGDYDTLWAVAAKGSTNIWAVGFHHTTAGLDETLALRCG
jgi:hypothetical protein